MAAVAPTPPATAAAAVAEIDSASDTTLKAVMAGEPTGGGDRVQLATQAEDMCTMRLGRRRRLAPNQQQTTQRTCRHYQTITAVMLAAAVAAATAAVAAGGLPQLRVSQHCSRKFSVGSLDLHSEIDSLGCDQIHQLPCPPVIAFDVQQHACLLLLLALCCCCCWHCKVLKGVPAVPAQLRDIHPQETRGSHAKPAQQLW
jgi:hypothetical protein